MSPLYTPDILRLALVSADFPPLSDPDASVAMRTPVCGSHIRVDVRVGADGRVAQVGMDIHACAVGQASAGLFAASAAGRSVEDIDAAAQGLARWLSGAQAVPPVWPDIELIEPARASQPRHAAIMLAFNAGARAARDARDGAAVDAITAAGGGA